MLTLHFEDMVPSVEIYSGTVRSSALTRTAGVGGNEAGAFSFLEHEHANKTIDDKNNVAVFFIFGIIIKRF